MGNYQETVIISFPKRTQKKRFLWSGNTSFQGTKKAGGKSRRITKAKKYSKMAAYKSVFMFRKVLRSSKVALCLVFV